MPSNLDKQQCSVREILPSCLTVCLGSSVTIEVPLRYGKVCSWEQANAFSETWSSTETLVTAGARCNTLTVDTASLPPGRIQLGPLCYRAWVKDCHGHKWVTNVVTIKLQYVKITQQPQSVICDDGLLCLKVEACPSATIQWQELLPDEKWHSIVGAQETCLPPPYEMGRRYRALVTNYCQQVTSSDATVGYVAINQLIFPPCADEATLVYEGIPPPSVKWIYVGGPMDGQVISTQDTLLRSDLSQGALDAGQMFRGCVYNECQEVCTEDLQFHYLTCRQEPELECDKITIVSESNPSGETYAWTYKYQSGNAIYTGQIFPNIPNVLTKAEAETALANDHNIQGFNPANFLARVVVTNACQDTCILSDLQFGYVTAHLFPRCGSSAGGLPVVLQVLSERNLPFIGYAWYYSQKAEDYPDNGTLLSNNNAALGFAQFQNESGNSFALATRIWVKVSAGFNPNDICLTVTTNISSFPRSEILSGCTKAIRSSNSGILNGSDTWLEESSVGSGQYQLVNPPVPGNTLTPNDLSEDCLKYGSRLTFQGYDIDEETVKSCYYDNIRFGPFPNATINSRRGPCRGTISITSVDTCQGQTATLQWQMSQDGATNWTDVTVADTEKKTFTAEDVPAGKEGWYIRICAMVCQANSNVPGDTDYVVYRNFDPFYYLQITVEPEAITCEITQVKATANTNYPSVSYQWQERVLDEAANWTDIVGSTTDTLLLTNVSNNSAFIRVKVTGTDATTNPECQEDQFSQVLPVPYVEVSGVTYDCQGIPYTDYYAYPAENVTVNLYCSETEEGIFELSNDPMEAGKWYYTEVINECGDEDLSSVFQYVTSFLYTDLSQWTPDNNVAGWQYNGTIDFWQFVSDEIFIATTLTSTNYDLFFSPGSSIRISLNTFYNLLTENDGFSIQIRSINTDDTLTQINISGPTPSGPIGETLVSDCFSWPEGGIYLIIIAFSPNESEKFLSFGQLTIECCPPE